MTTATTPEAREKLQSVKVTVANHHVMHVERYAYPGTGDEEIIGTVPAGSVFGDWRSDDPDTTTMSPTPEEVCRDVSAALGFAVKLADADGGIVVEDDGPITVHFELVECTCGADRTGPSAEAHDVGCPLAEAKPTDPVAPANRLPAEAAAPPAQPEPTELDRLRALVGVLERRLAEIDLADKARRRKGLRIIELRSIMEADKKRAASSKAALEEAVLSWVNDETQEAPLWDYAEKQGVAANGTPKPAENIHGNIHAAATPDDSWKSITLDDALSVRAIGKDHGLSESVLKKLDDADLHTMGDLVRYQEAKGREHHAAPLATIKGIKGGTIEKIDNACQEFWRRRGQQGEPKLSPVDFAAEVQKRLPEGMTFVVDKSADSTETQQSGEKSIGKLPATDPDQVESKPAKKKKAKGNGGKRK